MTQNQRSIIQNLITLRQNIEECLKDVGDGSQLITSATTPSKARQNQDSRPQSLVFPRMKRNVSRNTDRRYGIHSNQRICGGSAPTTPKKTKRKKTQTPKYSQIRKHDPNPEGEQSRNIANAEDDYTDGRQFRLKLRCFNRWLHKWYRLSMSKLAAQIEEDNYSYSSQSTTSELLEEDPEAVLLRVRRRQKLLESGEVTDLSTRRDSSQTQADESAKIIRRKKEILDEGKLPPIFYEAGERSHYPNPIERHFDEYKIPEFLSSSSSSSDMPPLFDEPDNPALFDAEQLIRTIDRLNDMDVEMHVPHVMTHEEKQAVILEPCSTSDHEEETVEEPAGSASPQVAVDTRVDLRKLLMESSSEGPSPSVDTEPSTYEEEEEVTEVLLSVPATEKSQSDSVKESSGVEIDQMILDELNSKESPSQERDNYSEVQPLPKETAKEIFGDLISSSFATESDNLAGDSGDDSSDFDPVLLDIPSELEEEVKDQLTDSSGEFIEFHFSQK